MISHLSVFTKNRTALAVGVVFAGIGLMFGTWAALIPYIKAKFGIDEAQLGLLLLALPAGVTLMNPFSVPILNKLGTVKTTLLSYALAAALYIPPIGMPTVWLTGFALFLTGAGYSAVNIAMNTCASQIEQKQGLHIMATCHGLWSAGAMVGAALGGMITGWGVSPVLYMSGLFVLQILLGQIIRKPLSGVPDDPPDPDPAKKKTPIFIKPNRALWVLIFISLCVNLTEGTMADWSAVYMREVLHSPESLVGWGFATYAFFMAAGRLLGDSLIARFGSRRLLLAGGIASLTGLTIAVFAPGLPAVLLGFAFVGAGVSIGAPILYAASAKVPGLPKGAGLATMNTFAMVAFLGGPALIGFIAKAYSLPVAFGVVACGAVWWVVQAQRLNR